MTFREILSDILLLPALSIYCTGVASGLFITFLVVLWDEWRKK